jgi:hypothetical protein
MSHINYQICLDQIRDILGLRPQASPAAIVAKVRETKAAADLAGHALLIERGRAMPAATAEQDDDDLPIGPRRELAPSIRIPL